MRSWGPSENTMLNSPAPKDVLDEVYEEMDRDVYGPWRHGRYDYRVVYREEDNTYWRFVYPVGSNQDYNGLREGDYEVDQVESYEVIQRLWRVVKNAGPGEAPQVGEGPYRKPGKATG